MLQKSFVEPKSVGQVIVPLPASHTIWIVTRVPQSGSRVSRANAPPSVNA